MRELVWKTIAWSPLAHSMVLTFGSCMCFIIAYNKGDVSIYLPYISENGALIPEMNIFSYVCIVGCFLGILMFFYRFMLVSYITEEDERMLHQLNFLGFLAGLISMAGLAGVAAVPMSTMLYTHVAVAGVHFMFATIYSFLHSYITFKINKLDKNEWFCKLRIGLSVFLVPCSLILMVLMPLGHFKWIEFYPDRLEATKTPQDKEPRMLQGFKEGHLFLNYGASWEDKGKYAEKIGKNYLQTMMFWVLFCGSLSEWIWYTSWLTYLGTFFWENKKFELVVIMRQREGGSEKISQAHTNGDSTQCA